LVLQWQKQVKVRRSRRTGRFERGEEQGEGGVKEIMKERREE
jgi:hypothetical protein